MKLFDVPKRDKRKIVSFAFLPTVVENGFEFEWIWLEFYEKLQKYGVMGWSTYIKRKIDYKRKNND